MPSYRITTNTHPCLPVVHLLYVKICTILNNLNCYKLYMEVTSNVPTRIREPEVLVVPLTHFLHILQITLTKFNFFHQKVSSKTVYIENITCIVGYARMTTFNYVQERYNCRHKHLQIYSETLMMVLNKKTRSDLPAKKICFLFA